MKPALTIVMPMLNEAAGIATALQALQALRARGVEELHTPPGALPRMLGHVILPPQHRCHARAR
jgi:hypothetical protein